MHHRKPARAETPIERIFREETGRKMPTSLRSILLHKPMAERDPHLRLVFHLRISGFLLQLLDLAGNVASGLGMKVKGHGPLLNLP